jgi:DNA-directed RNA polymerase specialized sigma24 family protein
VSTSSPQFPHTHWTLIHSLRGGSEEDTAAALDSLCRAYWYPLYAAARRKGLPEDDAQDIVQALFLRLLSKEAFHNADQTRGKLRSFLLSSLDHLIVQEWKRENRLKRGAGATHLSWGDLAEAEERLLANSDSADQDTLYLRDWASSLLERALHTVRQSYAEQKQEDRFTVMAPFVTQPDPPTDMATAAATLGMKPDTFRVMVHRLRQHYRERIEHEISMTLDSADPALIRAEMQELFRAFG